MQWSEAVWVVYSFAATVSLLSVGRRFVGHPNKWHIGLMASSYTLICWFIALTCHQHSDSIKSVFLVVAGLLGAVGLSRYWRDGD